MGCHLAMDGVPLGCWHPLHMLGLLPKMMHLCCLPSCALVLMHRIKSQVISQVGKLHTGTDMAIVIYGRRIVPLLSSNLTMANLAPLWLISILTFTHVGKLASAITGFFFTISFPFSCSFPPPPLWFFAPFLNEMPRERGKPSRGLGSLCGLGGRRPSPLPSSNLSDSSLLSSSPATSQQEDDSWANATLVEEEIPSDHLSENS